jgi:LSD1 subclass zinc finger protein
MNCPSCGAPMRLTSGNASLQCDYCKNVAIAMADDTGVQLLEEVVDRPCPACGTPLWNSVLARVRLNACKKCHGLLVPMGTFGDLLENMRVEHPEIMIPSPADPADLERKVDCPLCHKRMDTHFYFGGGNAVMSSCENCEVHWLDGGVLMRIVRAPRYNETASERVSQEW